MQRLRPVDRLVVDVALDNTSDSYSSKPAHVSPEFNNVVAAGAKELSGPALCCAQLGLALVLTAYVGDRFYQLLFEEPVRRAWEKVPKQRGLSGPAWTCDDQR